jgi:hypothetical protein
VYCAGERGDITEAIASMTQRALRRLAQNGETMNACIQENGGHFQHLLWTVFQVLLYCSITMWNFGCVLKWTSYISTVCIIGPHCRFVTRLEVLLCCQYVYSFSFVRKEYSGMYVLYFEWQKTSHTRPLTSRFIWHRNEGINAYCNRSLSCQGRNVVARKR